jgi:hypothetical protein
MRIPEELKPQYTRKDISDPRALLSALLSAQQPSSGGGGFRPMSVSEMGGNETSKNHSLIVGSEYADIVGQVLPFLGSRESKDSYPWPLPFLWVNPGYVKHSGDGALDWDRCIPAEKDASGNVRPNDYLVMEGDSSSEPPRDSDPVAVSWLLCQLLAHRRSRLFGWSLERRIFNVLLPHALLHPSSAACRDDESSRDAWIVQPSLSLFLTNKGRGFRSIFSLTLFVIPVRASEDKSCVCQSVSRGNRSHLLTTVEERKMSDVEIGETIQAGWNIATSPRCRPEFTVSGPLCRYLEALDPSVPEYVPHSCNGSAANGRTWGPLTLRKTTEAIALATVRRLVAGAGDRADSDTTKRLGEKVLVALSSSRASSVVVVDDRFKKCGVARSRREGQFPGSLDMLMEKVGVEITVAPRKKYRLDRSFFDSDDYAIGVLPADRCVVVTADPCAQRGNLDSGLLEAGWLAYMTIGAATATGMMRSIYHEIEQVSGSNARAIADIEREVVVDLHEIYDLDITWPPYRERYRLLRDRFGITRDYESLQSKLLALSRESSTRFEDIAQRRLIWLTAAIVLLTLVVVVVTVLVK